MLWIIERLNEFILKAKNNWILGAKWFLERVKIRKLGFFVSIPWVFLEYNFEPICGVAQQCSNSNQKIIIISDFACYHEKDTSKSYR